MVMKKFIIILTTIISFVFLSCSSAKGGNRNIAVFIPGICADSPTYAMLRDGVIQAVDDYKPVGMACKNYSPCCRS